jgi:rubrerythrin
MIDVEHHDDQDRTYECFECGEVIPSEEQPSICPNCGGSLRNRHVPVE